ncbi:MAG: hypothetical protein ACAI43_22830 [Phycisphaerae bacterium]|nr:hypothetical protein [Tepidisphaeraceae bacterium]
MMRFGVFLLILGIGSFVLPLFDVQFKIMAVFGEAQPIVAGAMIGLGALLLYAGRVRADA